jgi:hypothetical protein
VPAAAAAGTSFSGGKPAPRSLNVAKSFEPTYQERVGRAAEARQKALDRLKARPKLDEAELEARNAARLAREAEQAEARKARKEAREAEKSALKAAAQAEPVPAAELTEAERKAVRDARYAARKARK